MADFMALPVQTGVGDYHFNRYRIVFRKPDTLSKEALAADFIGRFPDYLDSEHATVTAQARTFEGKPTLKFHGFMKVLGIDLAAPHHDWVVRQWVDMRLGFTAQTLKRLFLDSDDVMAGAGATIVSPLAAPVAVETNRMHFLAGRRSWRLDHASAFGIEGDLLVLETTAVERFSAQAFRAGDAIAGLERRIPDIWVANLTNFVTRKGLAVVPQPLKGRWQHRGQVDFVLIAKPDLASLRSDPEFVDALRLFPSVIDFDPPKPNFSDRLERALVF